jgi:hypothetical protein
MLSPNTQEAARVKIYSLAIACGVSGAHHANLKGAVPDEVISVDLLKGEQRRTPQASEPADAAAGARR